MRKHLLLLSLLTASINLTGCSTFTELAQNNKFTSDDGMTLYYNERVNLQSHTFGDFKFASTKKEFKKINSSKPAFKNILLYAKTFNPSYEYYILLNAKPVTDTNYLVKDTLIHSNRITLAVAKNVSIEDYRVLAGRMAAMASMTGNGEDSKYNPVRLQHLQY